MNTWIKTADRLPKVSNAYLCTNVHGGVWIYFYRTDVQRWEDYDEEYDVEIFSWQPIPKGDPRAK